MVDPCAICDHLTDAAADKVRAEDDGGGYGEKEGEGDEEGVKVEGARGT